MPTIGAPSAAEAAATANFFLNRADADNRIWVFLPLEPKERFDQKSDPNSVVKRLRTE